MSSKICFVSIILPIFIIQCVAQEEFSPDSTVNGIFILLNKKSANYFYNDISKIQLQDKISSYNPFGYTFTAFVNKDSSQYLIAFKYDGNESHSYSAFEIGNVTTDFFKNISGFIVTDYQSFKTESGIGLNMPLNQLLDIKGENSCIIKDNSIVYWVNVDNSDFVKRHNMPEYTLEVDFDKDNVNKIHFGFTYP